MLVEGINRLAFFDIDGTLVNPSSDKMSQGVKEAVLSLEQNGVKPIIISGRPLVAVKDIAEELNIDTVICFNGSLVLSQGKRVHSSFVDPFILADLIEHSSKQGHGLAFAGVEGRFKSLQDNKFTGEFEAYLNQVIPYNPEYYQNNDIFQVDLLAPIETIDHYSDLFEGRLKFFPWDYYPSATQVIPAQSSKAVAFEALINYFGVSVEDTYAFGDGVNDVDMLEFAGTGVAMGNAGEKLKSVADLITGHVDNDGVVTALKDLGLIS